MSALLLAGMLLLGVATFLTMIAFIRFCDRL